MGPRRKMPVGIAALREGAAVPDVAPERPQDPTRSVAERRQLTVMSVDLVGSVALSSRLDPEEMGTLIRSYQNAVAGGIARLDGHVAKFMGDGVLAYFGWPPREPGANRRARASLKRVMLRRLGD